jgi:hypothetical protein
MSTQQIKNYLTLIRVPNLFTLPSNVMAGYFSSNIQKDIEIQTIIFLILISACLYATGVILNDLADRKIDQKERPNRPIPARKVAPRNAIILALLLILISVTISLMISSSTVIIVFLLIFFIFAYDFLLKNSPVGPVVMGMTRLLNVLLGSSPYLMIIAKDSYDYELFRTLTVSLSELAYITGISALSRYETYKIPSLRPIAIPVVLLLLPILIGVYSTSTGLFNNGTWIYLIIFGCFIAGTFRFVISSHLITEQGMQTLVSWLIAGIIVHDTIYIGGSLENWYLGISTFLWLVPVIVLTRRYYAT